MHDYQCSWKVRVPNTRRSGYPAFVRPHYERYTGRRCIYRIIHIVARVIRVCSRWCLWFFRIPHWCHVALDISKCSNFIGYFQHIVTHGPQQWHQWWKQQKTCIYHMLVFPFLSAALWRAYSKYWRGHLWAVLERDLWITWWLKAMDLNWNYIGNSGYFLSQGWCNA